MTPRPSVSLAAAALVLFACGSGEPGGVIGQVQGVLKDRAAARTAPAAAVAGPHLSVALRATGQQLELSVLDRDGRVTIWQAPDHTQLYLQDGLLIGTRGLGADLMSADAPGLADLVGGPVSHSRSYHYLDGSDAPVQRVYTCTVAPAPADAVGAAHHLLETCISGLGSIENEYWIAGDLRLLGSRQWVSRGIGYAEFGLPTP